MKSKLSKSMTAADLMRRLQGDPNWVRENAKREAEHKAAVAKRCEEFRPEENPLLADLNSVGVKVDSVWDLVNAKWSYRTAIPVLSEHLQRARHPLLREGIVRALTVPEARGIAGRVVLSELSRSGDQSPHLVRWAMANALTVVADETMADAIKQLIADDDYADVRERLTLALRRLQ